MNSRWYKTLLYALLLAILVFNSGMAAQPAQQVVGGEATGEEVVQPVVTKDVSTAYQNRQDEIFSSGIEAAPPSDNFGYTWSDDYSLDWNSISDTGEDLGIVGDDVYSAEIPFPSEFIFPFYEYEYDSLKVSSNGLILFDPPTSTYSNNLPIPFEGNPQNFVAPLWDDLRSVVKADDLLADSKAYVDYDDVNERLIIEWENFYFISGQDPYTFQAILYKTGDICFQYHELPDLVKTATVGIEDSEGVDGLAYVYNEEGINNLEGVNKALCYFRPVPDQRVKVLPYYQGDFAYIDMARGTASQRFQLTITNIGEAGPDNFELTHSSTPWKVKFLTESYSPLLDTDADDKVETGVLAEGAQKTIWVEVESPVDPAVGSGAEIEVLVTSMADSLVQRSVAIQTAVPVAFTEALINPQVNGIFLNLYWKYNYRSNRIADIFTGASMALASTEDGGYIYVWEKNLTVPVNYVDIEYANISSVGTADPVIRKVTDNFADVSSTYKINDRYPALTVNAFGDTGVVWTRNVISGTGSTSVTQSNMYLKFMDETTLSGELNITENELWGSTAPFYDNPRIATLADNSYILAWVENMRVGEVYRGDVYAAVYSPAGVETVAPIKLVAGGTNEVHDISLTSLSNGNFILFYTFTNPVTQENQVYFAVYRVDENNLVVVHEKTMFADAQGKQVDAIELTAGKVLVAWTATPEYQIEYSILNTGTFTPGVASMLPTPNGRLVDYVSVGKNADGYAFLTWLDTDLSQQLFYAAFDPDGALLTDQMAFITLDIAGGLVVNDSGYSSSSYGGAFFTSLPLIKR